MDEAVKKHGLMYSEDLKSVLGIDSSSADFSGTVPSGAKRIEDEAFSCCDLTEINLPESVEETGANVFGNSVELVSVKLPSGLKVLGPYLFSGCSALEKVQLPYEVLEFPEGLFSGCSSLKEVPFRNGLKVINQNALEGLDSVKSIVLPDSVEELKEGAVSDCKNLRTLVLGSSLSEFSADSVKNCPKLSRLRVSEANTVFSTDEEGTVLYKNGSDGSKTKVFEVENKVQSEIPEFNELTGEVPSIITFEDDDDGEENDLILSEEEASDTAFKEQETETEREFEVEESEPEIELSEKEEESMSDMNDDMAAKLAEIMGQDKQYGEGDFSINDIPEASEDEIEASKLESTEPESAEVVTEGAPVPVEYEPGEDVSKEMDSDEKQSMDSKLSEIMGQNIAEDQFSIMDIPAASDDEIAADKIVSEGDYAAGVEDPDAAIPEMPASPVAAAAAEEDDEKTFMNNLFFESEKVEQQNLDHDAENPRILYVFAETLADGQFGKCFSPRLMKCANKLASIHGFTSIFFFHGIEIENEKFRGQFTKFMENKDVVIACSSGTLSGLSEPTKLFAGCTGIKMDKDSIRTQMENAKNPDVKVLKLLIQDNLSD